MHLPPGVVHNIPKVMYVKLNNRIHSIIVVYFANESHIVRTNLY